MEDIQQLISQDEVQAALKNQGEVISQSVTRATSNFQGFYSLMLRVQAKVRSGNKINEVYLVAKILPPSGAKNNEELDVVQRFRREEAFFSIAEPLLKQRCALLPVVTCHAVRPNLLLLDDLVHQGYRILPDSMKQVGTILLQRGHVAILMQRLAEFHAASLDINWIEKMTLLQADNFFVIDPSPNSFYTLCVEAFGAAAAIILEFYPEEGQNAARWLSSPHSFAKLIEFSRTSNDLINVLAHGDFWINNMMFKEDIDSGEPIDVCFIDFQLCRYVHPTRDILHVMYTCLDRDFRTKHETDMLKIYVNSFNKAAEEDRLKLDEFILEYEKWRLAASLLAIIFRSLNLMSDIYPDETSNLSQEQFESILSGHQFTSMPNRYRSSAQFRNAIKEVLDEFLSIIKVSGIVAEN